MIISFPCYQPFISSSVPLQYSLYFPQCNILVTSAYFFSSILPLAVYDPAMVNYFSSFPRRQYLPVSLTSITFTLLFTSDTTFFGKPFLNIPIRIGCLCSMCPCYLQILSIHQIQLAISFTRLNSWMAWTISIISTVQSQCLAECLAHKYIFFEKNGWMDE